VNLKIAIIGGSGRMGKWFAHLLKKEGFEVVISGRDKVRLRAAQEELGVQAVSNTDAVRNADVILLSVDIDSFEDVVKEISPRVDSQQIVVDITSTKEFPVETLHRHLRTANILATHPLFGPGARDLANQNFALTPTNEIENTIAQKARKFLESKGARVTLMAPREHDEMMTIVLGLAHFVAILAADTLASTGKLPASKTVGGSTYRVLTTLAESVISEDPNLYATLQMRLPGLSDLEDIFLRNAVAWADLVKSRDRQGFSERLLALKEKYAKNNVDFGQAYSNMYKIMEWL